jgi:hypothetical protein
MFFFFFGAISFGCFLDFLYKSSDASLDLRKSRSNDGPISVNSRFGTLLPDFRKVVLLFEFKLNKSLPFL